MEVFGLDHGFIIAFAAFLLFFQFGMRYVITYHLTDITAGAVTLTHARHAYASG